MNSTNTLFSVQTPMFELVNKFEFLVTEDAGGIIKDEKQFATGEDYEICRNKIHTHIQKKYTKLY